jgi:leader peptidase (prepilin peptidase)/N-methyltransferase
VSRILPVLLAPFIGSFLGVLILRLPARRPVVLARSCCDQCGHRLGPRDLIPLVSYLLAQGRCRHCGAPIGRFALLTELAATGLAGWVAASVKGDAVSGEVVWAACLLGWTLLTAAWIDMRTMLLPDSLTLPLLLGGLMQTGLTDSGELTDHALAAALGYLLLSGVAGIYRWLRGRDGLGLGDAKLLAAVGAWTGLGALPAVLLLAASLGLLAVVGAKCLGKTVTSSTAIPFGPFLSLAGWLIWLYPDVLDPTALSICDFSTCGF